MKTNIFLFIGLVLLFVQCKHTKNDINEQLKAQFNAQLHPTFKNIAVIYDNDVYYLSDFNASPVQLTSSAFSTKTKVKVSHDGTKVAYLDANNNPVIIDVATKLSTTITDYSNVKKVEWSGDDKTLCILANNSIYFHGPALNIPLLSFSGSGTPTIISFSVSAQGDVAYCYYTYTYDSYYGYYYYNYYASYKKNTGGIASTENVFFTYSYSSYYGSTGIYQYEVDFAPASTTVNLSVPSTSGNSPLSSSIQVYPDPTSTNYSTYSVSMYSPVYRPDLGIIVGFDYNSNVGNYQLAAQNTSYYYANPTYGSQFNNSDGVCYLDWK